MIPHADRHRLLSDWKRSVAVHLQDRASRLIASLGIGITLSLCAMAALVLIDLRDGAWRQVETSSHNLLSVIEQSVARNIEIYDLSLQAAAEGIMRPDLGALGTEVRRIVLFERSATAQGLGTIAITDAAGDVTFASDPSAEDQVNFADRAYFAAHRSRPDAGLIVTGPIFSKISGQPVLVLSRRISNGDGSFAGVVTGAIKLSYFQSLFAGLQIGRGGSVNLYQSDGTLVVREPYLSENVGRSIAGSDAYRRFISAANGTFVARSAIDGVERYYTYAHLKGMPLFVDVAVAVDDILAGWWTKALTLGAIVLGLCVATIGLTLLLQRELGRRAVAEAAALAANTELAALALTDGLTGLPNRRRYDEVFEHEWRRASRAWTSLSLLVIDADSFKLYNDQFGHQCGDEVLKAIAGSLRETLGTLDAMACRIGGEEFAVILPGMRAAEAVGIAERIRRAMVCRQIPHAPAVGGIVTVSIGAAHVIPGAADEPGALFAAADAALYEAKRSGRNRVRSAEPIAAPAPASRRA